MSILSDKQIKLLALESGIIAPFVDEQECGNMYNLQGELVRRKIISYGLSSYGYDARVRDEYLIYHNAYSTYIDPKDFDDKNFVSYSGHGYAMIPPNSFVLCETVEYFKVPRNCLPFIVAKSTYARAGLVVNATVMEPEWEGHLTLELSNTTPLPIKVYSEEGIVQIVFFTANDVCEVSYADRKGKYQNQVGITPPKA